MALSRKSRIVIASSVAAVVVIGIVYGIYSSRKDTPSVTTVKIEKRRELRSNVTASGEVRPIQFINLTSEVQGRIEEIYVKEGDPVKKGTPLVKLDPTALNSSTDAQLAALQASLSDVQVSRSQIIAAQNQLASAEQAYRATLTSVDSARQQVVSAKVDLNTAERELKRTTDLVEAGVESKANYDAAKDKFEIAKIRLKSAELAVSENEARAKQQEVSVKDAKRAVDSATLSSNTSSKRAEQQQALFRGQRTQRDKTLSVAPINGVIADIPSKVGTFAVAGLSTTPLLTIADMSSINVEVKVDETSIDRVEEGQTAKIKVDAFGEREIVGKVIQKTPLAIGKSQTSGGLSTNINVQEAKEFKVVIQLTEIPDDVREGLRPGMSATADITTKTVQDVIAVPLQSVIRKRAEAGPSASPESEPAAEQKSKASEGVFVLEAGRAKFIEVTTGITGESDIQVLTGLSEGQDVITGPSKVLNTLKDGAQVKKQERKEGETAGK